MEKAQPSPFGTSQAVQPPDQIQERIRQRVHEIYEAGQTARSRSG
jgi:hypothetical protein